METNLIPNFPGYRVCSNGDIESCWRATRHPLTTGKWHRLASFIDKRGYVRVRVMKDKVRHELIVHTLVLNAFGGERKQGDQCRHLDGNKLNNDISNLRWGTAKENGEDRAKHGTNFGRKLTDAQVLAIRELKGKCSDKDAAIMFKVDKSHVRKIWNYKVRQMAGCTA